MQPATSGLSSRSASELQAKPAAGKHCRNDRGTAGGEKPLQLFCREGRAPVCPICDRSRQRHGHRVLPIEEASQEYKVENFHGCGKQEEIRNHLKSLKEKADKLKEQRRAKEQRIQWTVTQLELEKQEVRSAFERMQKFLEEKQHLWLDQLEKREGETLTDLSQEISQLSLLMTEREETLLQPAIEFLQDITNCLSRCEKNLIQYVVDLPPKLEERLRIYAQKNSDLKKAMQNCEVRVTMDPDTACHKLFLSKDLKTVRWDVLLEEKTDNPERFDHMNSVLGHRNFTSGRHWWEAEVQGKGKWEVPLEAPVWAIGIARGTMTRKGYVSLGQKEGIWAVGKIYLGLDAPCQALAFTALEPVRLTLRKEPGKIWVALHYEEGWVDFFDANSDDFIFTFYVGSFSGQRIRPFFYSGE
ncbi:zinc finger protein RFP-like isoform X2 [Varanus komodoensis]|uniref:zinc finger protein RFP-like isoform X2 n=1 Tax=Varanus komodoensis TaxID=61221 RepID=UPI001CF78591|nr:zinc finger protein RFP-like isoform X2 [Varanus komodoensis]